MTWVGIGFKTVVQISRVFVILSISFSVDHEQHLWYVHSPLPQLMTYSFQPQAMHSSQLLQPVLFCVFFSIVIYWIICRIILHIQHGRLQREQGCQPARTLSIPEYASESEIKRIGDMRKHVYLQGAINRYAKFGDTFQTSMFDAILFNTIEPANLQAILADNFQDYSIGERRKTAFRPLLEDAIFNSDGLAWSHSRRLLRPAFAGTREAELAVFERHVDNLIIRLHDAGTEVDLQPLFFQMTLDTASDILFGKSTLLLTAKSESSQAAMFADAFGGVQRTVLDHLCVGWISKLLPEPRYRRRLRYLQHFVDQIIEERRARSEGVEKKEDVRDSYLLDNLDEQILDPVKLRGQLMSLLVGGRDTTASLMSNFWHVLVRRPDIQEKLRAEIQHLGQKKPTYQDLLGIKYLRYCINECERSSNASPSLTSKPTNTLQPSASTPQSQ